MFVITRWNEVKNRLTVNIKTDDERKNYTVIEFKNGKSAGWQDSIKKYFSARFDECDMEDLFKFVPKNIIQAHNNKKEKEISWPIGCE